MILLYIPAVQALKVAMVADVPYTGLNSITAQVWSQAALECALETTVVEVASASEGTQCVLDGACDAFVSSGVFTSLVTSHPLLYDRPVMLTIGDRITYVSSFLWQFLALLGTLILPLVLISAHVVLLFEPKPSSYFEGLLTASWNIVTLAGLKRPLARLSSTISGLFVLFVLALIVADLASVFSNRSVKSVGVNDSVCATSDWNWTETVDSASDCVSSLVGGDVDWVSIGRLQLGYELQLNDWSDKLLLQESPKGGIFWYSGWQMASADFYAMDQSFRRLWQDKYSDSLAENYTIDIKTSTDYALAFGDPAWMLSGITAICLVLTVLMVSFIARNLAREDTAQDTLSFDKHSISNQNPERPHQWVEKAVPLDDEAAARIKDVKDYEKELSAIQANQWSGGVGESLLAFLK